jgi:dTDP-4-amino-4,6-dideoxygalactose transaminase
VPDYHHGNEIYAIRAAGANLRYYPVKQNLDLDLNVVSDLCRSKPRALYITHFMGWPQPVAELRALCRDKGILLIEDCALSFLSEVDNQPLGSFGAYSVFCLYKTLSLPNGGVVVSNDGANRVLENLTLNPAGKISVAARSVELMLQWLRSRHEAAGRALFAIKRAAGRTLSAAQVQRTAVGGTGFDLSAVNIAMSPVCHLLMRRFSYDAIKETRRRNYRFLEERLAGIDATLVRKLEDGVCPLFFPLLVQNKQRAAEVLWQRGIETVEFWNNGDPELRAAGAAAQFLRNHVLEVPIHQEVTGRQLEYMADQIVRLGICMTSRSSGMAA